MQMVWKNQRKRPRPLSSSFTGRLPFEPSSPERPVSVSNSLEGLSEPSTVLAEVTGITKSCEDDDTTRQSQRLQNDGDSLAEEGKYGEALGKWEAAIALTPASAVLHEQKAQVLMELGRSWLAVQAATRATELQPSWPEAWITLARAQLNYGEPGLAVVTSQTALQIQPDSEDAQAALETARHLAIKQRQVSYVGTAAATRLAVGGVQSMNPGPLESCQRVVVVDGKEVPTPGNSEGQVSHADPAGMQTQREECITDDVRLLDTEREIMPTEVSLINRLVTGYGSIERSEEVLIVESTSGRECLQTTQQVGSACNITDKTLV